MAARAFTGRKTGSAVERVEIGCNRAPPEFGAFCSGCQAAGTIGSNAATQIPALAENWTTGAVTSGAIAIGAATNSGITGIDSTGHAAGAAATVWAESASASSFSTG